MPVDMVGRELQPRLEAVELALDLGPDLAAIEETEQRPQTKPRGPGKVPAGASRGIGPTGVPSVRLRCRPMLKWPRCARRRGAAAGQCGELTITLVADRRLAAASSPMAREMPSVMA